MFQLKDGRITAFCLSEPDLVMLPESATSLGARVFQGMEKLRDVLIRGSIKTIGDSAFEDCSSLHDVVLEEGLKRLGNGCFRNCTSLQTITLPETVVSIHPCAFQGCTALREIHMPHSLRRNIERQTFGGCVSLEAIVLPRHVEQIKTGAFSLCMALRSVTFGNPDVQIEPGAFRGCDALPEDTRAFIAEHTIDSSAIQIKSRGSGALGRLSNFTPRSFVFEGVACGSIEGVLQSFKCPDPQRQQAICALTGGWAKKAGSEFDWKAEQCLHWQGQSFPRRSEAYQQLLDRLYDAVFEQDEGFRADLAALGGKKIDHRMGLSNPSETVLTRHEFVFRLQRLSKRALAETSAPDSEENPAVMAEGWKNASPSIVL